VGNRVAISAGTAAAAGGGGQGVPGSSGCCESSAIEVDVDVMGTSSICVASAESWPHDSGTLVAHNASDASATLQARRGLLSGAMLEVEILSETEKRSENVESRDQGKEGSEIGLAASVRPISDSRCIR
jgi:hypothetical protein